MTPKTTTLNSPPSFSSDVTVPGPSYYNTRNVSTIERWLRLTGRPHMVRGASKYRGVSRNNTSVEKPWRCALKFRGYNFYGGQYATEEEAALAWNQLVLRYIGPEAEPRLNKVPNHEQ